MKNAIRLAFGCGVLLLAAAALAQQASITLACGANSACNATNTTWQLGKCDLDAQGNCTNNNAESAPATVKWQVTASKVAVSDKIVTVYGYLAVTNSGSAPASIGNIVVNLQKQVQYKVKNQTNSYWVSASNDIADAQWGDLSSSPYTKTTSLHPACATTGTSSQDIRCADVVAKGSAEDATVNAAFNNPATYTISGAVGTFRENNASGTLVFYDTDNNNGVFSLNPTLSLPVGATLNLAYTAKFDNTILGLADNTSVRAEALVTFGNAGARGGSGSTAQNVDVDGDGSTTDDGGTQARTVACRWTGAIPTTQNNNAVVDLADADPPSRTDLFAGFVTDANNNVIGLSWNFGYGLYAFGDVTYKNFQTDIGATNPGSGTGGTGFETLNQSVVRTVSADITNVGSSGLQALANCAILTEDNPSADTCSVPVQQQACAWPVFTGGGSGGNFCTVTHGGWASPMTTNGNNPGVVLANNFGAVYGASGPVVTGNPSGDFTDTFTSAAAINAYVGGGGKPGSLTADQTNPPSDTSGIFGKQVLTLKLNVDFSTAGVFPKGLGALLYFPPANPVLPQVSTGTCELGVSIAQILADANLALGTGTIPATCSGLSNLNDVVNNINTSFDNSSACPPGSNQ